MKISSKVAHSFKMRLISSLLLGKWISKSKWIKITANQSAKGMIKYGHYLDDCPNDKFNWTDMFCEEMVDGFSYLEKIKQLKNKTNVE